MKTREYKTQRELQDIADVIAGTITFRIYEKGNSRDITRKTTKAERAYLTNVVWAALHAANWERAPFDRRSQENAICNMAEGLLLHWEPRGMEVNGYDTVYIPLRKVFETWPDENPV